MPEAKSVVYGVWFEDSCLKQDKHFFFCRTCSIYDTDQDPVIQSEAEQNR